MMKRETFSIAAIYVPVAGYAIINERLNPHAGLSAVSNINLLGKVMEYGMPGYKRNGSLELSFASQKQYIAIYAKPELAQEFREELSAASIGKSCIRFTKPEQIDFKVIAKLLKRTKATPPCAC